MTILSPIVLKFILPTLSILLPEEFIALLLGVKIYLVTFILLKLLKLLLPTMPTLLNLLSLSLVLMMLSLKKLNKLFFVPFLLLFSSKSIKFLLMTVPFVVYHLQSLLKKLMKL